MNPHNLTGTDGAQVPTSLRSCHTAEPSQEPSGSTTAPKGRASPANPSRAPRGGFALRRVHLSRPRSRPRERNPGSKEPFHHRTAAAESWKGQARARRLPKERKHLGNATDCSPPQLGMARRCDAQRWFAMGGWGGVQGMDNGQHL